MDDLDVIGWLLILFSLFGVYANFVSGTLPYLFWVCNHTSFIMGIAFLYRSSYWIMVELSLGLFGQFFWSIDYLFGLFFGMHPFQITQYMFSGSYPTELYMLSMGHFFTGVLAFYGLYKLNEFPKVFGGLMARVVALIPFSFYFGAVYNLNCTFKSCIPYIEGISNYTYWWPIVGLVFVLLANRLVCWIGRLRK